MVKYLKKYIKEIKEALGSNNEKVDWKEVLKNHRVMIGFIQHERLIHLLVTLAFGLGFLLMMGITLVSQLSVLGWVDLLLLVLLIPYVFHYFKLENGVQRLYRLDEKIREKV